MPHRKVVDSTADLAEERRLAYVGITRARDRLYLTRAAERLRYGKRVSREPSRFLRDIPEKLIVTEDLTGGLGGAAFDLARDAQHETRVQDFLTQMRARLS